MPSDATLRGWGVGGCLLLDTDTESYVTSPPVSRNVAVVSIVDEATDISIVRAGWKLLFFIFLAMSSDSGLTNPPPAVIHNVTCPWRLKGSRCDVIRHVLCRSVSQTWSLDAVERAWSETLVALEYELQSFVSYRRLKRKGKSNPGRGQTGPEWE